MDYIEVKIRKFERLIKRADIKTPNWFAVEHNLLLHPDFFDISGDELKVYLWIIGTAAHLHSESIRVYPEVCASQLRVTTKLVRSCIEKLSGKRWDVTDPSRVCTGENKVTNPTVQGSTGQDSEVQDSTGEGLSSGLEATSIGHPLGDMWNLYSLDLSKIRSMEGERLKNTKAVFAKLKESEWIEAIQNVAESDVCNGRKKGFDWKATYDWFIGRKTKKEPYNFLKALEGNYANNLNPDSLFKSGENYKWANAGGDK